MTQKQEQILKAALKLFATEGFASTSTSKVAKTAGVSEGLIFRHFGNKEGLLRAIMEEGQEAAKKIMAEVVLTAEPKEVIRKMLEIPFLIEKEQYEMWRLIYALKWQTDQYGSAFQEPVKLILRNAFEKLGYPDPTAEVELIFMFIDGAATSFLLHEPSNKEAIWQALLKKYNL
jgi:AcrR family transcriptional regulator